MFSRKQVTEYNLIHCHLLQITTNLVLLSLLSLLSSLLR
jgi:hypothetical protein